MQALREQYSSEAAARGLRLHVRSQPVESLLGQEESGRSDFEGYMERHDLVCLLSPFARSAKKDRLRISIVFLFL